MSKTVTSIVQDLLDKGHITAEEAVILLKAEIETQDTHTAPYTPTYPVPDFNQPYKPQEFWYTTSTGTGEYIDTFTNQKHKAEKELIKG